MNQLKISFWLLIFVLSWLNCAPTMMKAKMAQRDQRYDRALELAVKHLRHNPQDVSARKFVVENAVKFYDARKAEIVKLEQFEYWDKMVVLSLDTYTQLQPLTEIPHLDFPTKIEIDFLKSKLEYSREKQTEVLYQAALNAFERRDYQQAIELLNQVHQKHPNYKETERYLTWSREKLAAAAFDKGLTLLKNQDFTGAVTQFQMTLEYQPNHPEASNYLQQSRLALANQAYQEGRIFLQQKEFVSALEKFEAAKAYTANFQDVDFQISRTKFELAQSLMARAKESQSAGQYQTALATYQEVLQYQPENAEARSQIQVLREKLTLRLAVLPFQTDKLTAALSDLATEEVLSRLTAEKNEYLYLVDREHLKQILEEQALSQTGIIDETQAVQVGKLSGVNRILTGKVNLLNYHASTPVSTVKTAYYQQNYLDPKGIKRTKKVPFNYTQYEVKNSATLSVSYQLINVETSQIEEHQTFSRAQEDVATWVTCDKERVQDLPGNARSLLTASKVPKSREVLIQAALNHLTQQVSTKLMQHVTAFQKH